MTDEELLDAWRTGDQRAGQQLFRRHRETVRRFIVNKVDDGGTDAEDLIQRVFLACVEGQTRFEGRSSFRTYMLGIARNLVLQHWESRRRGEVEDIDDLSIAALGGSPSSLQARNEHERCLLEGLRRLGLGDQIVLELYYWEQLSAREIGEVLGISTETAQSRVRRARQRLGSEVLRLERLIGVPESTEDNLDKWARAVRGTLVAKSSA